LACTIIEFPTNFSALDAATKSDRLVSVSKIFIFKIFFVVKFVTTVDHKCVSGLKGLSYALKDFRPRTLRALRIFLPALVAILERKP
jgi:hypothetical protein